LGLAAARPSVSVGDGTHHANTQAGTFAFTSSSTPASRGVL